MKVGDVVKYRQRNKETTGIITEVAVRGIYRVAHVYWNTDIVFWEYEDELEVVK